MVGTGDQDDRTAPPAGAFPPRLDDPVAHVMTMKTGSGRRFCCVLPSDMDRRVFQLEIDVEDNDYINFATYLSPHNDWPTRNIAAAWEQMRARDPLAAAQRRLEAAPIRPTVRQAFHRVRKS